MYGQGGQGGYGAPQSNYGQSSQTSYVPSYANYGGGGNTGVSAASVASGSLSSNYGNNGTQMGVPSNPYSNPSHGGANPQQNQRYGGTSNPYSGGQTNNTYQPQPQHGQSHNQYGQPQQQQQHNPYGQQNSNYQPQQNPYGQQQSYQQHQQHQQHQQQPPNPQAQYGTSTLQNQYAQMNISQQDLLEQHKWFNAVDKDHSGTVDVAELSQLTFGGKALPFPIAKKLMYIFDKDRNGAIDFAEYITLHKFIVSMQRVFNQTDTDRNGTLDSREIHQSLQQAGFQLSPQAVNALHHRHNKTNQGVDFVHYLEIAADIALLRVEFDRRDSDRDGVVSARFDDILCMVANI